MQELAFMKKANRRKVDILIDLFRFHFVEQVDMYIFRYLALVMGRISRGRPWKSLEREVY